MNQEYFIAQAIALRRARKHRRDVLLFLFFLIVFIGLLGVFFFLSEKGYAAETVDRYILFVDDYSGSMDEDAEENQRGIAKCLDSLKVGDEGQIMLITDQSFSNPENILRFKMPPRAGYFPDEIKRKKAEIIRAYREKVGKIARGRPGTSLVDGMFMFAKILSEQEAKRRILVVFSDMRQCLPDFNEDTIITKGDSILSQLKGDGLIPPMKGIEVYCMGVTTRGLPLLAYRRLGQFWLNYFCAAGASLKCYDIGRTRSID
jgi:hypothetical protein